jgi:hypothetical protein
MTAPTPGQGTAQPGRASPLGSAARLSIDGLPREALLAFSAQVAALLRYTAPPEPPGRPLERAESFAPFFESDLEVQLALIATFRPEVAAAPLRGEIARLAAGAWRHDERARIVPVVKAALATLDDWWARLQGPPGVSGLGALQRQVALLAPFARQLKNLVQQLVVGPLRELLAALPELFEVTRGLDPALWGPVAQRAAADPGEPPAGAPVNTSSSKDVADLLSRLTTSIQDAEQRRRDQARIETWIPVTRFGVGLGHASQDTQCFVGAADTRGGHGLANLARRISRRHVHQGAVLTIRNVVPTVLQQRVTHQAARIGALRVELHDLRVGAQCGVVQSRFHL